MVLSLNSKMPLYLQIKEDIMSKIREGFYSPGDQLPPELQLAESYKVSRPTVRQAVIALVQEGLLIRDRGIGTFIAKPIITEKVEGFKTFEQLKGLKWSKLVEVKQIKAPAEIAQDLQLQAGDGIFEATYVKGNENEELVIRKFQIPSELAPGLFDQDIENKRLYAVLQEIYNLITTDVKLVFQSQMATEEEAELLKIDAGDPLTLFETIHYTYNKPFAKVQTLYRGDRFRFIVDQGSQQQFPYMKLETVAP